ncbi:MAG: tail fiber protein [Bacteroidetes bacterium]|nr:tail fiber protein [Bacteroidota bacterium]
MDGYLGEIKMFAGNYPPACWAYCQGQILPVSTYPSLFAILGNTFGGDGYNSFGLPDMSGRGNLGAGTGPGLSTKYIGMKGGYERIYLYAAQLPQHTHTVNCDMTSSGRDASSEPEGRVFSKCSDGTNFGADSSGAHIMEQDMLNTTGNNDMFEIMQPWTCINHIICVEGQWPPRN